MFCDFIFIIYFIFLVIEQIFIIKIGKLIYYNMYILNEILHYIFYQYL